MRPPPPRFFLSSLALLKPGICGVLDWSVSFVSCMAMILRLYLCIMCVSSVMEFLMPFVLNCRMLKVCFVSFLMWVLC